MSVNERGIDEETVKTLEGMICTNCTYDLLQTIFCVLCYEATYMFALDADIDGQTLVLLVEDYTEFSGLVPKPGLRLKIKKYLQHFTPSVPVAVKSSSI